MYRGVQSECTTRAPLEQDPWSTGSLSDQDGRSGSTEIAGGGDPALRATAMRSQGVKAL